MADGRISISNFYESLDVAEEMYSERMQEAVNEENSENALRYKGALEAVKWLKHDLCYDIYVPIMKRKGMI